MNSAADRPAPRLPRSVNVAVIGGGPAGSATAIALCRLGISGVLLVERHDYRSGRIGECIPPATRGLLEALGVWNDFQAAEHEPALGSCSAWGSDHLGFNDSLFDPDGHGWHLDRRRFDAQLANAARDAGADLRLNTRCSGIDSLDGERFRVRLQSGRRQVQVGARFVVDATGSGSRLTSAWSRRRVHDRLSCSAAVIEKPETFDSRLTWLEATEYGWWYAARLPGDRVAVAVAADPDQFRDRALHRRRSWRSCLETTRHLSQLAHRARGGEMAGPLQVRTAPSFVLDDVTGPGWLAVGDAASSYDPIASQGIYKSLLDGTEAAQAIADCFGGVRRGLADYRRSVQDRFAEYLNVRNHLYDLEQRWPTAPFWQRRHSRRSPVATR